MNKFFIITLVFLLVSFRKATSSKKNLPNNEGAFVSDNFDVEILGWSKITTILEPLQLWIRVTSVSACENNLQKII